MLSQNFWLEASEAALLVSLKIGEILAIRKNLSGKFLKMGVALILRYLLTDALYKQNWLQKKSFFALIISDRELSTGVKGSELTLIVDELFQWSVFCFCNVDSNLNMSSKKRKSLCTFASAKEAPLRRHLGEKVLKIFD